MPQNKGSSVCRSHTNPANRISSLDGDGRTVSTRSSPASSTGGMYVGSSQAGIDAVNDAVLDQICESFARHGGADLGTVGLDRAGLYPCVCCSAHAHEAAVCRAARPMGLLFSSGG